MREPPEKKIPQMSRLSPFILNDLVLSLLSLQCPFRPALVKFAETVYDMKFIGPKGQKGHLFGPVFFPWRALNLVCKSHQWLNRD